jgi:hypothetical protein
MPSRIPSQKVTISDQGRFISIPWFRFLQSLYEWVIGVGNVTATLDFPNTAAQTSSDLTVSVPGAVDGDEVTLTVPSVSMLASSCYNAWVSAADTVTVRFNNYSAGALDPASGDFRVVVRRY